MSSTTPPQPTQDRPTNEAGNDSPTISRAPAWSDTDSDPGAPPFVRDQEFWLDDGTIILIARGIGFRVYRGLLAAQSPIFQDTFSCASPSKSAGESFDGCPVVHLNDSPEDLRYLLRVILPVTKRTFFVVKDRIDTGGLTFDQVSSVIRIAHKYEISDVQRQALDVLKIWFPSDFDAFDAWRTSPPEGLKKTHAIAAVNIARLTNTPDILPLALYMCVTLRGYILNGWRRQDGTIEHLDSEDLRRCLNARDSLFKEGNDMRINMLQKSLQIGRKLALACSGALLPPPRGQPDSVDRRAAASSAFAASSAQQRRVRALDPSTILPLTFYRTEHLAAEDLRRCTDGRDTLAPEATASVLFQVFHPPPVDGGLDPSFCRKRCRELLI
ncbi:hypothetical protein VTO73DRAFT_11935 [Trametes versicolor]